MTVEQIRFNDGATYERYMGAWSQLAGSKFLDWLAPAPWQHWLDVGCGNGAFTEMVVGHRAPASVHGVDPSEEQLAFARARPALHDAKFRHGDAMRLPYPDGMFDIAIMPLVIFFVPEPAIGVSEMARVVRAGGTVAAYAWDMPGGGFPYELLLAQMREMGLAVPAPPSPDASRAAVMHDLWTRAGLDATATCVIDVQRTFADFDDFWTTACAAPSVGATLRALDASRIAQLKTRVRDRLPEQADARITYGARANAVKGRVPT